MGSSQTDQLTGQIDQLEAELALLAGSERLKPDAERRVAEIEGTLPRLREEVQRILVAAKPGS